MRSWNQRLASACAPFLLIALVVHAAPALQDLPVNEWVRASPDNVKTGYDWSRPVFVPSRAQLLQWGGAWKHYRVATSARDDVRAFDAKSLAWTSEYEPTQHGRVMPVGHGAPPLGVSYYGTGGMSKGNTPYASAVFGGGCYDSKRDQLIYVMKGLMAAYDLKTRKWRAMGSTAIVGDKEYTGGPPANAISACYDPVNDEIVVFPHWTPGSPVNTDLQGVTGAVSSHLGTMRYSFSDNTWQRVGGTLGSGEVRKQRKDVLARMAEVSRELDTLYAARRRPNAEADAMNKEMAAKARVLRELETKLESELRIEPPPRCGSPMIYHPGQKAIVVFGGHSGLCRADIKVSGHLGLRPGVLNDTWVYDCATRQWREIETTRRPPGSQIPQMFYDPGCDRIVLLTFSAPSSERKTPGKCGVWSLDLDKGEWSSHGTVEWKWSLTVRGGYASAPPMYNVALDEKTGLVVFSQNVVVTAGGKKASRDLTCVMKLDLEKLETKPAPEWKPDPPIVPQVLPPDDPTWVAKLKSLPANTWTLANPKPDAIGRRHATRRDWGVTACDPVRGHVYYFGGGHSTYQIRDVAIYAPGANQWVHAADDHNDFIPPVSWGGSPMGFRGGAAASHQRNSYVAVDGRMYKGFGTGTMRPEYASPANKVKGPRTAWFYDVDRGGTWRRKTISDVKWGAGVKGTYGGIHLAHPAGKVMGFGGRLEPYSGRRCPAGLAYFASHDIHRNTLTVKKIQGAIPDWVGECRPFCVVPDRGKDGSVFFYAYRTEGRGDKRKVVNHGTWLYDIAENRFTDLQPKVQPQGLGHTVEYLAGQDAVWAVVNNSQEWVYSFKHNTWAKLPTTGSKPRRYQSGGYGQTVFSARYGVLVHPRPPTRIMRPDCSVVKWE